MNLNKILEYQKLDSDLVKIERQIKENSNKKLANKMHEKMREAQDRSLKLEEKAGNIFSEIEKVKKQFKIQQDKMEEFSSKDIQKLSKEELNKLVALKDKLAQNLSILERNLSSLAENVNAVLADFNKTIKTFNSSKEQFSKSKEDYESDLKAVERNKKEIEDKLKNLSKSIEPKIMEAYQKRRKENIFPVVVPLINNSCGGCHIELPYANISKLQDDSVLTCEHCHRLIYKANN